MTELETIAVALSCSETDAGLIAYAGLLARLSGAREVRFVHVQKPGSPAESSAAALRAQMRSKVAAHFTHTAHTECDVLEGPLTDRLLDYITDLEADIIVLGGRRRVLGARLAMLAECSVAVIPDNAPATLTHMLVALDFSPAANHTLEWGTSLIAGESGVVCTALHVMTHESADIFTESDAEMQSGQAEAMRKLLARTDRNGVAVEALLADVQTSQDVGRRHRFFPSAAIGGSDVAHSVVGEATRIQADCIVMSTRGRSASASILLGSVTEKVIERSPVPLLIHKHAGARLGLADILLNRAGRSSSLKAN